MLRTHQLDGSFAENGPGNPGGYQAEHKLACILAAKKVYAILGCVKCCQQVKEGDHSPLFTASEATAAILCSVPSSPVQET